MQQWTHQFGLYKGLDYKYPGTENTRKMLAELMKRLVDQILKEREDDTKSLKIIINILELLIFKHSTTMENLEKHNKSFYQAKSKLEVKLYGKEKHTRIILMDRVQLQHERCDDCFDIMTVINTNTDHILGGWCSVFSRTSLRVTSIF